LEQSTTKTEQIVLSKQTKTTKKKVFVIL